MYKPKIIATAVCSVDLLGINQITKHQMRVFTANQTYNVTRIKSDHLIVIDNNNEEHFCLIPGWGEQFKIDSKK